MSTELLWTGNLYNMSGYAKINREMLIRVGQHINVQFCQWDIRELEQISPEELRTLKAFEENMVSPNAPFLRFYPPLREHPQAGYRICYTMQETEVLHPEFAGRLNKYYSECWVPTYWGKRVFEDSGVSIPIYVMPCGVDTNIYTPEGRAGLPECELISSSRRGAMEVPKGFVFFHLGQPTFRKNLDMMISAFEKAFRDDEEETCLVLATTAYSEMTRTVKTLANAPIRRSKIYLLEGCYTEPELAELCRASSAYLCASLGEGWNLPLFEAAACGKPVIAPRNTAHLDFLTDENSFLFDPEGQIYHSGSEKICAWYDQMPMSKFGPKSFKQLVAAMKEVREDYSSAMKRGSVLTKQIQEKYTWDVAADRMTKRILSL